MPTLRLLGFPAAGDRRGWLRVSLLATGARGQRGDATGRHRCRRTWEQGAQTWRPVFADPPFAGSPWSDARSVGLCWVAARAPDTGAVVPGTHDYSRVVTTLSRGLSCLFRCPLRNLEIRVLPSGSRGIATPFSATGDDATQLDVESEIALGPDVEELEAGRPDLLEEVAEGPVGLGGVDDLAGVHVPQLR